MHREQDVSLDGPRYARVRPHREARNGTGLEPPEAHTGAQLGRLSLRRYDEKRGDEQDDP